LIIIYNSYITSEARVLLTSRKSPASLEFAIADLKSRILGSNIVAIGNPDDDLLSMVLAKQLHDKGFKPTDDVLRYAVERMDRSWPGVKKLSDILNKLSLEQHKPLTRALVREALINLEP